MSSHEVDRHFSKEHDIVPSSGFSASVMDAIHRETATPPPLQFPWRRALPGLLACLAGIALLLLAGSLGATTRAASSGLFHLMNGGWIGLGLVLSAASIGFSFYLIRRRV